MREGKVLHAPLRRPATSWLLLLGQLDPLLPAPGPLDPLFARMPSPYFPQVHFVEIDIEQDAALAEGAGVNGTPTVQVCGRWACD